MVFHRVLLQLYRPHHHLVPINTWLAAAKADGLHFHFGMDGPNFSIAIQTLFALGPDGTITSEQRTVPVVTKNDHSRKFVDRLRKAAWPAMMVITLGVLISFLFVDCRGLLAVATGRGAPLAIENITLNQSALGDWIQVELTGADRGNNALWFRLKRGVKIPVTASPTGRLARIVIRP